MPKEICILCGNETHEEITTHVDFRTGYIDGMGQLCISCFNKSNYRGYVTDNEIERIMKNRTTLVTISAEDILNTPNDMELGAKVRNLYHNITK